MNMSKSIPVWAVVCLVILSASVTLAVATTPTNITIFKPYTETLTFTTISVNTVSFTYSTTLNQYTSCSVTVLNNAASTSTPATPSVQISLMAGTTVVASGSNTGTPLNGQATQIVPIT